MGRHKRQGKTIFTLFHPKMVQYAIHRSPSGHYSCIAYQRGVQQGKSQRITQEQSAKLLDWDVDLLQEFFKLN